jgi:hypothetical protein
MRPLTGTVWAHSFAGGGEGAGYSTEWRKSP